MALFDDYIIATSAVVITASVIILSVLLARYRQAVSEAQKSAQLAKNVWDSMNGRLAVMDARIIDLMAKVDVYSTRSTPKSIVSSQQRSQVSIPPSVVQPNPPPAELVRAPPPQQSVAPAPVMTAPQRPDTEVQILQLLMQGPKTANAIREVVPKSREHMARVMRILFERGLVMRNDQNKPYVYEISEAGRRYLAGN